MDGWREEVILPCGNLEQVSNPLLYQRWIFTVRFISSDSLKWRFIATKTEKTTGGLCWKRSRTKGKQTKKIQYSWICSAALTDSFQMSLCFQSKFIWLIILHLKSHRSKIWWRVKFHRMRFGWISSEIARNAFKKYHLNDMLTLEGKFWALQQKAISLQAGSQWLWATVYAVAALFKSNVFTSVLVPSCLCWASHCKFMSSRFAE